MADTICAVATPPGRGGIGIIRLSGDKSLAIAESVCRQALRARHAHYCSFHDGVAAENQSKVIDNGIALFFPGPNSYTGEDVVELQCHGSPVVLDLLLKTLIDAGARQARPGEFSERAYINDKLDLAQAEAVADLINSGSEQAARGALRSLQGQFSATINAFLEQLVALRVYVEAALDFPDEDDIDLLERGDVAEKLQALQARVQQVLIEAKQGTVLREGMHIAIAGRPNAGKSSLLNALTGDDRAIVTPIAGTTRDVLRETINIDGLPLHIMDTAGLRDSPDIVEQEGIRRAHRAFEQADRILFISDSAIEPGDDLEKLWPGGAPDESLRKKTSLLCNKIDISKESPGIDMQGDNPVLKLSIKTGEGFSLLKQHLHALAGFNPEAQGMFTARRRHLSSLQKCLSLIEGAVLQVSAHSTPELVAEDLRAAHDELATITGNSHPDILLGEIFSSFCIGK